MMSREIVSLFFFLYCLVKMVKRGGLLLELFSGTGSIGKAARKNGFGRVISVDFDEGCDADYTCDVRKLPYKTLPTPDFIWASPPCTTYSYAAIWYRHRDENGKALTAEAKEADRILRHTFQIINYFLKKNPTLKFCIENPRGYMQKMPEVRELYKCTTSYNNFGFPIRKPTDFFSNYRLQLPECRKLDSDLRICGSNMVEIRRRMGVKTGDDLTKLLYRIPPKLAGSILRQASAPSPPSSASSSSSSSSSDSSASSSSASSAASSASFASS